MVSDWSHFQSSRDCLCSGECDNINVMSGHTGAIVQLTFNQSGDTIYTASVDKTIGMFDSMTGQRIKRMKGGVATDENNRSL